MESSPSPNGTSDAVRAVNPYSPDGAVLNLDEIEEDPTVCEICLDGEVFDDNEIIFCDKCNVAVHQMCYSVPVIPEGQWFCYVCASGGDPQATVCELCSNTGGAYKMTDKGKWAHPLCAAWVPEVYEVYPPQVGKQPMLNLANLDKKRFKLKCDLCTTKGACIQCSYGRCTTAAHPWCVLKKVQGYTRRIIKNEEGLLIWEVFCKAHAKAVSEPLKPKPKSKTSALIEEEPAADDYYPAPKASQDFDSGYRKKPRASDVDVFGRARLSMAHANQYGDSNIRIYNDADPKTAAAAASATPVPSRRGRKTIVDDDDEDEAGPAAVAAAADKGPTFPVLGLLEWPGQTEGEAMDLDHYWNVMATYFPEDHSADWLDFMLAGSLEPAGGDPETKFLMAMNPLGSCDNAEDLRELAELTDEKLGMIGGERERNSVFDQDKRNQMLAQVSARLAQLTGGRAAVGGEQDDLVTLPENVFYTREVARLKVPVEVKEGAGKDDDGAAVIKAVFDGDTRMGCEFRVRFPASGKPAAGWHEVNLSAGTDHGEWVSQNLLPDTRGGLRSSETVSVSLSSFHPIKDSEVVYLTDQAVIPRDEDNILCRAIRTDQAAYSRLMRALQTRMGDLVERQGMREAANSFNAKREQWSLVNDRYTKQQIWKQVCQSLHRGIRDQQSDFNKVEAEVVPASWSIQVSGRPTQEEDEPEVHEDSVCMCCFDGTSVEGNRILFCDGCNATLHQTCYGVGEIPEGDFFCDRCRYIQIRAADPLEDWNYNDGDVKNAVMCALCPQYHGGLKPTTDGRWVHLCCAFWTNAAQIRDVKEMGPVILTDVPVQPAEDDVVSSGRGRKPKTPVKEEGAEGGASACAHCQVTGGFVVQCSSVDDSGCSNCSVVAHPICAWFDGCQMCSDILDPTFQGPSGTVMSFGFKCTAHADAGRALADQKQLRLKYRISEDDLEQIPEKNKRKRKKPKKAGGVGRGANAVVVKDLNPDQYDQNICGICLEPTSLDIFSCGYDPLQLTCDLSSFVQQSDEAAASVEGVSSAAVGVMSSAAMDVDEVRETHAMLTSTLSTVTELAPVGAASHGHSAVDRSVIMTCATCGISIHKCCYLNSLPLGWDGSGPNWQCETCVNKSYNPEASTDIRCLLCPRRGGYFKRTNDDMQWAHAYCALSAAPGKVLGDNIVDVHGITKEKGKQKCAICNRKGGFSVRCNFLGCTAHFHPICGMRSGKAFMRSRNGQRMVYCFDHLPEGVERLPSGYWVDGYELNRLRYCLDRARLITDILLRREKYKKSLCKAELEWFHSRFSRALDKAAGRKHRSEDNVELSDDSCLEEESSDEEDDFLLEEEKLALGAEFGNEWVPLISRQYPSPDKEVRVELCTEETVPISATFTKKGELRVPHKIAVSYAGLEVTRKDTQKDTEKGYLRNYRELMTKNANASRPVTQVFASVRDETNFARNIGPLFEKHMAMPNEQFEAEMEGLGFHKVNFSGKPKKEKKEQFFNGHKVKRGYAVIEEGTGEEAMDVDEPLVFKSPLGAPRGRGRPSKAYLEEQAALRAAAEAEAAAAKAAAAAASSSASKPAGRPKKVTKTDEELEEEFYLALDVEAVESSGMKIKRRLEAQSPEAEPQSPVSNKRQKTSADTTSASKGKKEDAGKVTAFFKPQSKAQNKNLEAVLSKEDRAIVAEDRLPQLERVIFDIINEFDFYVEPEEPTSPEPKTRGGGSTPRSAAPGTPKSKGRAAPATPQSSKKKSGGEESLKDALVNILHTNLTIHSYHSLAEFVNGFYDQLNGTREAVSKGSVIWDETTRLADIFERCREKTLSGIFYSCKPKGEGKELKAKVNWTSSAPNKTQYAVTNWPSEFKNGCAYSPPEPKEEPASAKPARSSKSSAAASAKEKSDDGENIPFADYETNGWADALIASSGSTEFQMPPTYVVRRKDSFESREKKADRFRAQWDAALARLPTWQWVCPPCVGKLKHRLIGREIQVWWHDDAAPYRGEVNAFDPVSGNHRVLYEDDEWEFVNLAIEPFVVYPRVEPALLQEAEEEVAAEAAPTRSHKKK